MTGMAQAKLKDDDRIVPFPAAEPIPVQPECTDRTDANPAPDAAELPDFEGARAIFAIRGGEGLRVGPCLAAVRRHLGFEIDEIAAKLRFQARYLSAIETMTVGALPTGNLTMMVRTYARELGLPDQEVVSAFLAESGAARVEKDTQHLVRPAIERRRFGWHRLLGLALVIAASVAAANWIMSRDGGTERTDAPAAVSARYMLPGASAPAGTAVAPTIETLPLELVAVAPAFVEIRGADGTIYRSRVMQPGERYYPRLDAGWTVTAIDGAAFEWRVGERVIGPLGEAGREVYDVSIDAAAIAAGEALAETVAQ